MGVALKNLGSRLEYSGTGLEQQLTPDGTQPGTKDENFSIGSMDSPLPTSLDIAVGYQLSDGLSVMTSFENFSYQLNTISFGAMYSAGNVWLAAGTKMNVQKSSEMPASEHQINKTSSSHCMSENQRRKLFLQKN